MYKVFVMDVPLLHHDIVTIKLLMRHVNFYSYMQPCILESTSRMFCTAPSLSGVHYTQPSHQLRIGLLMDGVTSLLVLQNTSLTLFPDPMFQTFMEEIEFITGSPIALTIQGSGFFFTREQVRIQINPCSSEQPEECQCHVTNVLPNNNVSTFKRACSESHIINCLLPCMQFVIMLFVITYIYFITDVVLHH